MKTNEKLFDNIYMLLQKGNLQQKQIGEIVGCSESQVGYVKKISNLAKQKDFDLLENERKSHGTIVRWAIGKFNIPNVNQADRKPNKPINNKQELFNQNDKMIIELLGNLLAEIRKTNEFLEALK